jgi:hypothetical protein
MSDDDVISEALIFYNSIFGSIAKSYSVIQDPYLDPLSTRTYGNGDESPYYLNNGCKINIKWMGKIPNPEFILGTYSNPDDAYSSTGIKRYLENQIITSTIDDAEDVTKLPTSTWSATSDWLHLGKTYSAGYRDESWVTHKILTVNLPNGFTENEGKGYLVWTNDGLQYDSKSIPAEQQFEDFVYNGVLQSGAPTNQIKYFQSDFKDSNIIDKVIEDFKGKVSKLHGVTDYKLDLCSPDTGSCSVIEYKSPLEAPTNSSINSNQEPKGPTQSPSKIKLVIDGIVDKLQVKAKENLPKFTIWTGPIPKLENFDDFDDLTDLDSEYMESEYRGYEETGLDFKAWQVQTDVSNSQVDSDSFTGEVGEPADIKPYSSFDSLINLAGKCARELGKYPKVNAENMKKGYNKELHGLCPQGTQAVLYALTGIKAVGQIRGNADYFSFGPRNPSTKDSFSSFSATGYFNDKVKITQKNGSWKGTYITDKSQWQVGDVIAMAYNSKSYGHIQVYTGFCWMSDFKQGGIQQSNVNPDSVALWRLNQKGIDAVKKQNGTLV